MRLPLNGLAAVAREARLRPARETAAFAFTMLRPYVAEARLTFMVRFALAKRSTFSLCGASSSSGRPFSPTPSWWRASSSFSSLQSLACQTTPLVFSGRATRTPQNVEKYEELRLATQYCRIGARFSKNRLRRKILILSMLSAIVRKRSIISPALTSNRPRGAFCTNHPSSVIPKRSFRIAFTTCGFAFPPVTFIT